MAACSEVAHPLLWSISVYLGTWDARIFSTVAYRESRNNHPVGRVCCVKGREYEYGNTVNLVQAVQPSRDKPGRDCRIEANPCCRWGLYTLRGTCVTWDTPRPTPPPAILAPPESGPLEVRLRRGGGVSGNCKNRLPKHVGLGTPSGSWFDKARRCNSSFAPSRPDKSSVSTGCKSRATVRVGTDYSVDRQFRLTYHRGPMTFP